MHFFVHVSTNLQHVVSGCALCLPAGIYAYWLNIFETISISASAAAIFSAEDGCGRWPKRKDIVAREGACWQICQAEFSVVGIA